MTIIFLTMVPINKQTSNNNKINHQLEKHSIIYYIFSNKCIGNTAYTEWENTKNSVVINNI